MARPINVRALRGFRAVIKNGSVTAAAADLGVTQPAISRMLAQLEREIGFELFFRDRGRLLPTNDAMMLLEEVDLALAGVERVERLIDDISQYRVGELRLVAPPSVAEGIIPPIAARFLARFPDVHLAVDSRKADTSMAMIATREADCGFVKLPIARPDLEPQFVLHSGTVCVLPEDHRLTSHASINPADLKEEPLILLGLGRSSRNQIEAAFDLAGVRPRVRVDAHTVGSACALASQGLGIAIVNELLARYSLRPGLVTRPFDPPLPQSYAFVTSSAVGPTRLTVEFLAETRAIFAQDERINCS